MAMSTCVKCGGTRFELVEHSPAMSKFKVNFIQCASCGGVVGVTDYWNTGEQLNKVLRKLGIAG